MLITSQPPEALIAAPDPDVRSEPHRRLHTLSDVDISVDLDSGGRLAIRGVHDDGTVTNADVELVDADGKRRSATVMTHAEVGRLMETWRLSGECQSGAFLRVPDLIIVRDSGRDAVTQVFAELLRDDAHRYEMTSLDDA